MLSPALAPAPTRTTWRDLSRRLTAGLTLLVILSSFLVMQEPAPCDLLFAATFGFAVVTGQWTIRLSAWPLAALGASLFLLGNVVSLAVVQEVTVALRFFGVTVYLLLLWSWLLTVLEREGFEWTDRLVRCYIAAALVAAAIGLLARFGILDNPVFFRDESALRIKSTFKDPNVFAPFVVGSILLQFSRWIDGKERVWFALPSLGIQGLAVLFAFSRGAWAHLALSLTVFVGLFFLLAPEARLRARMVRVLILGVAVAFGGALVILMVSDFGEYFSERLAFQDYDQQRFGTQAVVLDVVRETPGGIGPGQWAKNRFLQAAHSTYVRVLGENGMLGLVGLILFLGANLAYAARGLFAAPRQRTLIVACIAVSVGALGESFVIDTLHWRHLFVFLALPTGIWLHARRANATPTNLAS